MKRLSWKYMAGLVDGEGCIDMQWHVNKRDGELYCTPRLRIALTGESGRSLLTLAKENFGGHFHLKSRSENPNWADAWYWGLNGKHLRAFLQNIVTHLYIKKEQALFVIWWIDNVGGRHVPREIRQNAIDELKAMKRDPQRLSERATAEFAKNIPPPRKSWTKRDSAPCIACGRDGLNTNSRGECYKCSGKVDAIVHPSVVVAA